LRPRHVPACSIAFCTDSSRVRVPCQGKLGAIARREDVGSELRPCPSTEIPFSTASPASRARSSLGSTPIPTMTRSAGSDVPSFSMTPATRPSRAIIHSKTGGLADGHTVALMQFPEIGRGLRGGDALQDPVAASITVTCMPLAAVTAAASSRYTRRRPRRDARRA